MHLYSGVNVVSSWHRKRVNKPAHALQKLLEHTSMFSYEIKCQQTITQLLHRLSKMKLQKKPNLCLKLR